MSHTSETCSDVAGTIERASALMYMGYEGNAVVQPYLLFFQAEG